MAHRLASRVARLEARRPRVCPECGGGGTGPAAYNVVLPRAIERVAAAPPPRKPDRCPTCGRPVRWWITFPAPRAGGG